LFKKAGRFAVNREEKNKKNPKKYVSLKRNSITYFFCRKSAEHAGL
jgi:YHS domain-containing protein